jgi:pectate lyase
MGSIKKRIGILLLGVLVLAAQAQDQCKPIGWATRSGRTGGAVSVTGGGDATPITVKTFADLSKYAADATARVIYIDGTLGSGWSGTSGDRLEIGSNKTIIGIRPGTSLKAPIHIKNASNVIVRNLVVNGPGSNEDQAWDNINIEGSSKNIWIDHCEFWDGQDGNSDAVKGADNLTYTWNIFGYKMNNVHNLSNLIGSSDSEPASVGKLNITFLGNWFKGIDQRGPRCRYGNVHVVNNLYTKEGMSSTYSIAAGLDCQILAENNDFVGTNTPIYTDLKAGTAANVATGNLFEGTSGNTTGYGTAFTPPYEYKSFLLAAKEVKAAVQKLAGATLASPTSCSAPSGILVTSGAEGSRELSMRGPVLVAQGFGNTDVDFLVTDVSGRVLEHRRTSSSEGSALELDLSAPSSAGVLLVSVRAPGQATLTARIQALR